VSRDDLLRLFEAARWAPSSLNEQPWRFVVGERTRSPEAYTALMSTLNEKNRTWATAAPALVLVAVKRMLEQYQMDNIHAWYDAGAAVAFLTIQATSQGLSIRQMEGFDRLRARDVCAVPDEFEPAVVMALGYVGDPEKLSVEKHRTAEVQPRARRPLGDFVFSGGWGREY
jgi:nitroreductase